MEIKTNHRTTYQSPLGPLTITASSDGIARLRFAGDGPRIDPAGEATEPLVEVTRQLDEYFSGERRDFGLELSLDGTAFQRDVWRELLRIPYGTTVSYKELAERVGRPYRVRAVAGAVASTPVPIVVPCHRVVASDGALTGYRGGLERKRALLDLEQGAPQLAFA